MVLKLTIATADGSVAMIQVASDAPMETVAETIAIELSIPVAEQQLRFNGRLIARDGTVAEKGLSDGDLILVSREETAQPASGLSPEQTEILDRIRSNTEIMARLRGTNPQLHDRIVAGDPAALQELITIFNRVHAQQRGATEDPASFDDPMSEDAQRAIMERIRRENVMENMHAAMEHNPESFGSVVMLFVDCKVNGVDGVKAFVDSGAQATIISRECAERCNILRLIDKNFEGMARGVGTAKIHGRIHLSLLTLGTEVFEVSFTVMDAVGGGYDVLLGLDMLRKHQACIDLVSNQLRIGGAAVPFLPEKDIPKRMREHIPPNLTDSESRQAGPSSSGHSGGSSSRISEQSISTLLNLGFSREESIQALEQCEGDADQAASLLAQSKYGF